MVDDVGSYAGHATQRQTMISTRVETRSRDLSSERQKVSESRGSARNRDDARRRGWKMSFRDRAGH